MAAAGGAGPRAEMGKICIGAREGLLAGTLMLASVIVRRTLNYN